MLVVRHIKLLKVPVLSISGNIPCPFTIIPHVRFELLGVFWLTPELINRLTGYCCSGQLPKGCCGVRIERA